MQGWYIQYIDRDPRAIARQEELEKKKKADLDHEERNRAFIERQLKLAREATGGEGEDSEESQRPTKLQRTDDGEKIQMALSMGKSAKESSGKTLASRASVFESFGQDEAKSRGSDKREDAAASSSSGSGRSKRAAVDAVMQEEEQRKEFEQRKREQDTKRERKENWVTEGIIVKVVNKKLDGGNYYKCKGKITKVEDRFCATVELLDSGDVLRLDQDDLETVIPKAGRRVRVVNGRGRGATAKLLDIDVDRFCARIRIDSGSRRYGIAGG